MSSQALLPAITTSTGGTVAVSAPLGAVGDTQMAANYSLQVSDLTEKLEDRMYQAYSQHSKVIQDRLQEFTLKMTQISHLETELKQACRTVETVYRDLCVPPEVGTSLREAL